MKLNTRLSYQGREYSATITETLTPNRYLIATDIKEIATFKLEVEASVVKLSNFSLTPNLIEQYRGIVDLVHEFSYKMSLKHQKEGRIEILSPTCMLLLNYRAGFRLPKEFDIYQPLITYSSHKTADYSGFYALWKRYVSGDESLLASVLTHPFYETAQTYAFRELKKLSSDRISALTPLDICKAMPLETSMNEAIGSALATTGLLPPGITSDLNIYLPLEAIQAFKTRFPLTKREEEEFFGPIATVEELSEAKRIETTTEIAEAKASSHEPVTELSALEQMLPPHLVKPKKVVETGHSTVTSDMTEEVTAKPASMGTSAPVSLPASTISPELLITIGQLQEKFTQLQAQQARFETTVMERLEQLDKKLEAVSSLKTTATSTAEPTQTSAFLLERERRKEQERADALEKRLAALEKDQRTSLATAALRGGRYKL